MTRDHNPSSAELLPGHKAIPSYLPKEALLFNETDEKDSTEACVYFAEINSRFLVGNLKVRDITEALKKLKEDNIELKTVFVKESKTSYIYFATPIDTECCIFCKSGDLDVSLAGSYGPHLERLHVQCNECNLLYGEYRIYYNMSKK